jgi:NADPH:quinone reductase
MNYPGAQFSVPSTMKAVRIHERGGPEVMRVEEVPTPMPKTGEVLIKVAVAGVNMADAGQRSGMYPNLAPLPVTLGYEVAGTVAAVGADVRFPFPGLRVVAHVEGGYAEFAVANAQEIIPLPENVTFETAIAVPIQGLTAYLALDPAARFQKGESVLVHAAAGGVGTLAVQLAKLLGASTVVGTARSAAKLDLIRQLGADLAVNSTDPSWVEQVLAATGGRGVDVVLDAVGGPLGQRSFDVMATFGRMVVFGGLSGQPTGFAAQQLIRKCLSVTGFNTPTQRPQDMMRAGQALVGFLAEDKLRVVIDRAYGLEEAAEAHRALEAGQTAGKLIFKV